jgi:hypothetical protein
MSGGDTFGDLVDDVVVTSRLLPPGWRLITATVLASSPRWMCKPDHELDRVRAPVARKPMMTNQQRRAAMAIRHAQRLYILENDEERLRAWGACRNLQPDGRRQGAQRIFRFLRGRHVVIIPENDEAGHQHAIKVATSPVSVAASVRLLSPP